MAVSSATLRTLHRIHRQLADLRSRLKRGPLQIRASEANVQRLEAGLADAKQQVKTTRMQADERELQLKSREMRIEDLRRKLNTCSSNREYQTLVEQIAADEQANSVLSDEILEMFDKVTELQGVAKQCETELQAHQAELKKLKERVMSEKESLENEVGRLTAELVTSEKQFPAEAKADYDRVVGARGEDGMAVLEGDTCGNCCTTVTPQTVNSLLLEQLVVCKFCGAFLYLPENREVHRHTDSK